MLLLRHWLRENKDVCERKSNKSASTASRNVDILADDTLAQFDAAIQRSSCLSLAINQSTDVKDSATLLVYVRFFTKTRLLEYIF